MKSEPVETQKKMYILNRPVSKCDFKHKSPKCIISPWGSTQTLAWKKKCQCPGRNPGTLPSQARQGKAWTHIKFWSYAPDAIPASNCVFFKCKMLKRGDNILGIKKIFYNNFLNLVVYIYIFYFNMNCILKS
jgi:hypothetical protein